MNTNNNIIAVFTALSIAFLGSTAILHEKTEIPTASMTVDVEETYGDLTYVVKIDSTIYIKIIDCNESATEITIPQEINSCYILKIGEKAFYNCNKLTSVILPEWLPIIEDYAFQDCESLKSITMPDALSTLGQGAFFNCKNLETIEIPDGLDDVEKDTFAYCKSLKSITLPESVENIEDFAFYGCTALEDITILNPHCNIYDSMGTISKTATICGYENSTAQKYAEKYNYKFQSLGEIPQKFMTTTTSSIIFTTSTTTTTTTTTASRTNTQTETGTRGTEATGTQTGVYSYSNGGTNTATTTTTAKDDRLLGDVNGDGLIDSVDATLIMSYYAYVSAYEGNGEPDTFPEYLDKYLNK